MTTVQLDFCLNILKAAGITDQSRKIKSRALLIDEGLNESEISEVMSALPPAPQPAVPAVPTVAAVAAPTIIHSTPRNRSQEDKAATKPDKPRPKFSPRPAVLEPAKRIQLKPENQFRVFHPAPVVSINRYGLVKWTTDGRQHKAGQLLLPRNRLGMLTVQFRYEGKVVSRSVGAMLETVGWVKRSEKKRVPAEVED